MVFDLYLNRLKAPGEQGSWALLACNLYCRAPWRKHRAIPFMLLAPSLLFWDVFLLLAELSEVRKGSPRERGLVNSFIKNF